MSESSSLIKPKSDGLSKSLDNNGDLTPTLVKVWDANEVVGGDAADLEKTRTDMNIANTASSIHARASQEPEQLSFQ